MRTYSLNSNVGSALELLEPRLLRAGDVGRLADGTDGPEVVGHAYDPAADLAYAHDILGLGGLGQTVAIIDSGIAYDHFALGGGWGASYRVVGGWDFAENDADPYDDGPVGFHGTHIAGIIGSSDETIRGLAPRVDLVALRVFDDAGHGDFDWIESALAWVHEHRNSFDSPITAVNLSIGGEWNAEEIPDWSELEDELSNLEADGILVAVAAGNDFADYGEAGLNYPAASPHVVPVASVGAGGQLSAFSQRHARVLAAPGESINSTVPDFLYGFDGVTDDFARVSGTSMATPYVAGASVLVREAFARAGRGNVSVREIYDHLYETADSIADPITGATYQRVDLRSALAAVLNVSPLPSRDIVSLGTVERVTIPLDAQHNWYEFTALNDGIVALVDQGDNGAALDNVEVFAGSTVAGSFRNNHQLAIPVQRGMSYQLHVPAIGELSPLSLARIISLGNDTLEIYGDQIAGEIIVQIGQSFAVAVDGTREQISLAGRLSGRFREVEVADTVDGIFVQLPTRVSALDSPGGHVPRQDPPVPSTPTSNTPATWLVVAAHPASPSDVQLSPLAADASFASGSDPMAARASSSIEQSGELRYGFLDISYSALSRATFAADAPDPWFTSQNHFWEKLVGDVGERCESSLIDQAFKDRLA